MRLIYLLLSLGVALVLYLSWLPDPHLSLVWFVPGWLARWSDMHEHGDLRTAVPFLFLGLCTGYVVSGHQRLRYRWFMSWLLLVAIVTLAEIGQLLLPDRNFRWADISWGSAGALIGILFVMGIIGLKTRAKA